MHWITGIENAKERMKRLSCKLVLNTIKKEDNLFKKLFFNQKRLGKHRQCLWIRKIGKLFNGDWNRNQKFMEKPDEKVYQMEYS